MTELAGVAIAFTALLLAIGGLIARGSSRLAVVELQVAQLAKQMEQLEELLAELRDAWLARPRAALREGSDELLT